MGFKELIWKGAGAEGDPAPDSASTDATAEATAEPVAAPSNGVPTSAVLTAEFGTIYARTGATGDPATDNLVAAFAELAGADDKSRQLAMSVAIRATGVDVSAVATTLAKREATLAAAERGETESAGKRAAAREAELKTLDGDTAAQVADLEAKIAALKGARDAKVAEVKAANDGDTRAFQTFHARVAPEVARLSALRQFLATLGKPSAPKK